MIVLLWGLHRRISHSLFLIHVHETMRLSCQKGFWQTNYVWFWTKNTFLFDVTDNMKLFFCPYIHQSFKSHLRWRSTNQITKLCRYCRLLWCVNASTQFGYTTIIGSKSIITLLASVQTYQRAAEFCLPTPLTQIWLNLKFETSLHPLIIKHGVPEKGP